MALVSFDLFDCEQALRLSVISAVRTINNFIFIAIMLLGDYISSFTHTGASLTVWDIMCKIINKSTQPTCIIC